MTRTEQALMDYSKAEAVARKAQHNPKIDAATRASLLREAELRKSIFIGLQKHEPTEQRDTAERRIARKRGHALMAAARQRRSERTAELASRNPLFANPRYETSAR